MGATAAATPGAQAPAPRPTADGMAEAVGSAVDLFDAAAQLESQGYGDAVARQRGYRDVFEMAGPLLRASRAQGGNRPSANVRKMMIAALGRMLVMLGGVVVSLAVLPANAPPMLVFVAGAVGWMCGQAASAGIWHGLGTARPLAAAIAWSSAPFLLALAGIVGLALGTWAPLLWAMWSISASVLVILRPGLRVVAFALGGSLLTVGLSSASHMLGMVAGCLVIVAACGAAVRVLKLEGATLGKLARPVRAAQLMGAVQALGQIVVLGMVLLMIGPTVFVAVAIAGLVAGAVSDPILESVHAGVRHVATFAFTLRDGRRLMSLLGVLGTLGITAAAVLTAYGVRAWFAPAEALLPIILATCLVAGVTAGTGLLLRAGTALGAMVLAVAEAAFGTAGEALLLYGARFDVVAILLVLSSVSVIVTGWLAARHMSRPAAW